MKKQKFKKGDRVVLIQGVPLYGFKDGARGSVAFVTPEGPVGVCFDVPREGNDLNGICNPKSGMVCLEMDLHKI
jgi:hypothetical protein